MWSCVWLVVSFEYTLVPWVLNKAEVLTTSWVAAIWESRELEESCEFSPTTGKDGATESDSVNFTIRLARSDCDGKFEHALITSDCVFDWSRETLMPSISKELSTQTSSTRPAAWLIKGFASKPCLLLPTDTVIPTFPITKSLWSYLKLLLICLLELGFELENSLPRGKPVGKSPFYRSFDRSANWRVKDYCAFCHFYALVLNRVKFFSDLDSSGFLNRFYHE